MPQKAVIQRTIGGHENLKFKYIGMGLTFSACLSLR